MTKEFIIKTLLPYKNDNSLCAYEFGDCEYLTKEGKKCAIGKHMKKGMWQSFHGTVIDLFLNHKENTIMTKKWLKQNIPLNVAHSMQRYHDRTATRSNINEIVLDLEIKTGFDLNELKV